MRVFPIFILLCLYLTTGAQNNRAPLRVMTFNIRYDNPQDTGNLWIDRREKVAALIRFHQADLIGIQEGLAHQVKQLDSLLPEYSWLGVGRDDGAASGEFTAIFYRSDRLSKLTEQHFWLSETPHIPGSKSWNTAITRMASCAGFKDKKTKKTFYFFNTHFDHISEEARYNSSKLLAARVDQIAGKNLAIITGDFNAVDSSSTYQVLANAFADTRQLSSSGSYGPLFTYKAFDQPGEEGRTIDFIFINKPRKVQVLRHGVLADNWNGKYPSDHLPVFVEINLRP